MAFEGGLVLYRPGQEQKRVQKWGLHCEWPPKWVQIPPDIQSLVSQVPSEEEEYYQSAFQGKVMEALKVLYGVSAEWLSLDQLMSLSREHWFWIQDEGTVVIPRRLWLEE